MTDDELEVICQIDQLPRKTSFRKLIELIGSDTLRARVFDFFGGMEKHQTFARTLARKNKRSGHVTLPSSATVAPSSSTPPPPVNTLKTDESKPIIISSAAKTKGKKCQPQEKTPSPPKKKRNLGPLLSGPLDPNIYVSDRLEFNLSLEEREPFKKLTPSEASDMPYELLSRASICLNYAVGTIKPLLVSELEITNKKTGERKRGNHVPH
ncbi:uncharacterized protein LOC111242300 [Vigna radiata var. radiata]|uniref:Uncharacterized protein LOC111242300 n=1 Tax=Vigna radiata var. radiata TaxID=3916 RepID=A0A3Q0FE17_VIGRR|nr:uncharacterized protein LOC111242300 [Vigna radiata var. radiata]